MILEHLFKKLEDTISEEKSSKIVNAISSTIDIPSTIIRSNLKDKEIRLLFNTSAISLIELAYDLKSSHQHVSTEVERLLEEDLITRSTSISDDAYHINFKGIYTYLNSQNYSFAQYFSELDSKVFKDMDIRFNRPEIILVTFLIITNSLSHNDVFDWNLLTNDDLEKHFEIIKAIDFELGQKVLFDSSPTKGINKFLGWGNGKLKNFKGLLSATNHIKHIDIWFSPAQGQYSLDISDHVKSDFLINQVFKNLKSKTENYIQRQNYKTSILNLMDEYDYDLKLKSNQLNSFIEMSLNMDF